MGIKKAPFKKSSLLAKSTCQSQTEFAAKWNSANVNFIVREGYIFKLSYFTAQHCFLGCCDTCVVSASKVSSVETVETGEKSIICFDYTQSVLFPNVYMLCALAY